MRIKAYNINEKVQYLSGIKYILLGLPSSADISTIHLVFEHCFSMIKVKHSTSDIHTDLQRPRSLKSQPLVSKHTTKSRKRQKKPFHMLSACCVISRELAAHSWPCWLKLQRRMANKYSHDMFKSWDRQWMSHMAVQRYLGFFSFPKDEKSEPQLLLMLESMLGERSVSNNHKIDRSVRAMIW